MLRRIISGREERSIGLMIMSMLSLGLISNKRGMLANLIGGFVVILVGASLLGPIAQEINNFTTCQESNLTILASGIPDGATGSFGGAGSNHFGGYTGEVKHNVFIDAVASTSIVKSNKSILNPDCVPIEGAKATLLQIVPIFFALGLLSTAIAMVYSSLRNGGMI